MVPDLAAAVHILDKDNKVVVTMGKSWKAIPPRTTTDRNKFIAGASLWLRTARSSITPETSSSWSG